MNAIEKRKLEAKLRALAFDEAQSKLTPFVDMEKGVREGYSNRVNQKAVLRYKSLQNIKARLCNTRRVALATACLMVGVCILSVLEPVPDSMANTFVERAKIWVGGILQMNIAFEPPADSGTVAEHLPEKSNWTSLQEISDTYDVSLLEPAQSADWELETSKVTGEGEVNLLMFNYSFTQENSHVHIFYSPVADDMGSTIFDEDAVIHETPVGTFHIGANEKELYANSVVDGRIVSISAQMEKEEFLEFLSGLQLIN